MGQMWLRDFCRISPSWRLSVPLQHVGKTVLGSDRVDNGIDDTLDSVVFMNIRGNSASSAPSVLGCGYLCACSGMFRSGWNWHHGVHVARLRCLERQIIATETIAMRGHLHASTLI